MLQSRPQYAILNLQIACILEENPVKSANFPLRAYIHEVYCITFDVNSQNYVKRSIKK